MTVNGTPSAAHRATTSVEAFAPRAVRFGRAGCSRPIGPAAMARSRLVVTVVAKSPAGPSIPVSFSAGRISPFVHYIEPAANTPAPESLLQ